jgi:hypothetical protein
MVRVCEGTEVGRSADRKGTGDGNRKCDCQIQLIEMGDGIAVLSVTSAVDTAVDTGF